MKKSFAILSKIIVSALTLISMYLLLFSPTTLRINNTHKMATTIINRVVEQSDNDGLKVGVKMLEESGLENVLLSELPKKYQHDFSYVNLYQLSRKYDEEGKITESDIGLKSKNNLTKVINSYLTKEINRKLREESTRVHHIISIYRYSLLAIVLLYVLAIVLFIFNRYWASVALLIGAVITYGALLYFVTEANAEFQSQIYSGINLSINAGVDLGLFIGVIVAIIWPFLLHKIRKSENNA